MHYQVCFLGSHGFLLKFSAIFQTCLLNFENNSLFRYTGIDQFRENEKPLLFCEIFFVKLAALKYRVRNFKIVAPLLAHAKKRNQGCNLSSEATI